MLFDHDLCENNQSAQAAYAAEMHPSFRYGVNNGSGLECAMLYSINLTNDYSLCDAGNRSAFERTWAHSISLGFRQERMKNSQPTLDAAAVGLSLLCITHCLLSLMPLLILPSLAATFINDERFHFGMVFLVLPISLLALVMGLRKHGQYTVLITGACGICLLLLVLIIGEEIIGEIGEATLTGSATLIVGFAHVRNFLLSRSQDFRPIDDSE